MTAQPKRLVDYLRGMTRKQIEEYVRSRATCPSTNGKDLEAWEKLKAQVTR